MKIRLLTYAALAASFMIFVINACTKDKTPVPPEICDPNKVYYERDIRPLLVSNCAMEGCHDSKTREEGLDLSTYGSLMEIVKKGNPSNSEIMEVITATKADKRMPQPPYPPLTATQISLISRWIQEGAKNNSCVQDSSSCVINSVSYSLTIQPLINDKCGNCHGPAKQSGGYNFSTYQGLKDAASSGKLYNSVAQNGQAKPMPENGKLQSCEIKAIKIWVNAGAPNN